LNLNVNPTIDAVLDHRPPRCDEVAARSAATIDRSLVGPTA